MLVPPKKLVAFGAAVLAARQRHASRRTGVASRQQEGTRRQLLRELSRTAFGRHYGLSPHHTYPEWQLRVPPRRYENFLPFIERMRRGESGVLWPGACQLFASTAGTCGTVKQLPVTPALLDHFHRACFQTLLHYHGRVAQSGVFRGRHLVLDGWPVPTAAFADDPAAAPVSRILARHLPAWVEKHYYESVHGTVAPTDAEAGAVSGSPLSEVCAVAGLPSSLLRWAQTAPEPGDRGDAPPTLQLRWPQLECVFHGGLPLGPYVEQLRQAAGPGVTFHEVFAATEAFIATQEAESAAGLRLLTDAGVFFEFIPLPDFEAGRLDALGPKALPIGAIKANTDYVLVLTTPGGLCRYVLGDIVRFVSVDPPRLVYVGRTALQLNAFGEAVQEKDGTEALTTVCQRHNWRIVNFHVAPYFAAQPGRATRGCHEWWIELKPGTVETPTGPVIVQELDRELRRTCARYETRRAQGIVDAPVARLVMPGVFEEWMQATSRGGAQHKVPRCRSDRVVAEDLCRLAPYSAH